MGIVTKKREAGEDGSSCWRLHINGRRTALFIERPTDYQKRGWGESQSYDLLHDAEGYLLSGSVSGLIQRVELIAAEVRL